MSLQPAEKMSAAPLATEAPEPAAGMLEGRQRKLESVIRDLRLPESRLMKPTGESIFSLFQSPRSSDSEAYPGDCVLGDNEEDKGIPEDLQQEELPQVPAAHSPEVGATCNEPPPQKRDSRKLVLSTDDQKLPSEENPSFKRPECGKGHSRLRNHLQIHTRDKRFLCAECGKSFSRKGNLEVHRRVHTGERPYKCEKCEKAFSCSSNLRTHHKTHLKKEAFSSTMSRKGFSGNKKAVVQHQRVHTDANQPEFTSQQQKEEQMCGAEKSERDHSNLVFEELKKIREIMDTFLQNQQSQMLVLHEIQKQLNILITHNVFVNSNVYSLGVPCHFLPPPHSHQSPL